ncbi:MAG: TolC family protein [Chitinispirillaceae bacterium]|nr:TolC family protein [Chitinispirillaceae bacterium]
MEKHAWGNNIPALLTAVLFSVYPSIAQSTGRAVELSAAQAVEMAMKYNYALRSLDHQVKGSGYAVKSAVTGFLPQATLNGTYTRKSGNDMFSRFLGSSLRNAYSIGLEIQQPIFTGFATLNSLRSAQATRTLQETTNEKTKAAVRYAVLQIYRGLVNLQKSKAVANEAVKQLEELTSNQAALMEQGMATEHDYLLTKASLAQARMNELEVDKSIASMKRQFAVLLGLPVTAEITLSDTAATQTVPTTADMDSLVKAAFQNRPDLRETDLQMHLSDLGVKLTRAAYFPTLVAGYSWSNSRPDQTLQDQWGDDWHAYAAFNFTLFDWGSRIFKVKKAKEQHLSLLELSAQKKSFVEKEVIDAHQNVEQSSKELEVAGLLVEAREKAYDASLAKHEEGVMPLYELLNAHSACITAKYQALQAATNLELALINLEMGGLGTSSGNQ